jgi:serine/threonine-protein kinase
VKPQNVLIDHDGSAKVSDFGVARTLDVKDELTESGTVLGTSDYIAPEQASGERAAEHSDQYSLGVVLYELLTGELPYPASNVMAVALRHLHDPVPSARERRPDVPARVDAIVARALAKRPRDRFASMEAMTAALEAALAQEQKVRPPALEEDTGVIPTIAGAPGQRSRPRAPRRSRRRGVALFLLAVGAVLAGLAAVQLGGDGAPLVGDDGGDGSPEGAVVRLRAVSDYDPEGGDGEHPEDVAAAADGDAATFWRTETYENFSKSGVGIVLRVPQPLALSSIVVVTDTPGYTARIQASNSEGGGFRDVSDEETVRGQTTFSVDTGGMEYRYYLLWITDPNSLAHVNEVHARTES